MQDFAEQLVKLRPMLVNVARRHLHNDAWIEDAVSETLVAALENPAGFGGRAKLRTWLVGILLHKAVDQIRRHTRERSIDGDSHAAYEAGSASLDDGECEPFGEASAQWGDPQERLARREFMALFDRAVKELPPQLGRAFVLRNWMDAETDDICCELGVTANHLGVMLHRARNRLRSSLRSHFLPSSSAMPSHA